MACCKCCCGNADCTEGQEGKCCCGGSSGVCCQPGEYCCNGECQSGPCCECGDGLNAPLTECATGLFLCVEYTLTGAGCPNQNSVGVSFYNATGDLSFRPCAENISLGPRVYPCGGPFPDAYDISGELSCNTVVYDEDCGCVASGCDWVNIVASWQNQYGNNTGQCDCVSELLAYELKESPGTCP